MIRQEAEMLTSMFDEVYASHDGVDWVNGILIGYDQACKESRYCVRTSPTEFSWYRYGSFLETKKPLGGDV